jgi:mannose-6-phosphate isomerase-like protein (cupin superfamily)
MASDLNFIPPGHLKFAAKWLAQKETGAPVNVFWGDVGHEGGGPEPRHTHPHDHIFIIVEGEAKVVIGDEEHLLGSQQAIHITGTIPHAIWNVGPGELKMVGIST